MMITKLSYPDYKKLILFYYAIIKVTNHKCILKMFYAKNLQEVSSQPQMYVGIVFQGSEISHVFQLLVHYPKTEASGLN